MGRTILGILLIFWGVACLLIGILRPGKVWNTNKIQGFTKLLGSTGTIVLLIIVGGVAGAAGIVLLL